jgi:Lipid membrane protein of large eukaryotic DNA viruses
MGASISSNVTNLVTNAIVRTSNEVIQTAHAEQNQSIIIAVNNTTGDVVISGNVIKQVATVSMSGLSQALNNSDNNIKLDQQIAQMAKAIISGLNLAQLADANNTVDSLIKTCIDVKNATIQSCLMNTTQTVNLTVEGTKGNVSVVNNQFTQLATAIQSCVEKAVGNNKSLQDISSTIQQAATSEAKGLSLAMIALIVVAMALTGVGGVYAGSKIIFPAVLIGAIVSFVLYFQWTVREVSSYSFVANTISETNDCSIPKSAGIQETSGSAKSASEKCENDSTCAAYEWYNGEAVFYNNMNISNSCKSYYANGSHKDTTPVIKQMIFKKGDRNPSNSDVANAWLNTSDGSFWINGDPNVLKYYPYGRLSARARYNYASGGVYAGDSDIVGQEGWNKQDDNLGKRPNRTIDWGDGPPVTISSQAEGDVWIDYKNPSLLRVYTYTGVQGGVGFAWQSGISVKGVGPIINSNAAASKSVGFAIDSKKSWLLYLAIGLLIVGVIGMAFTSGMFKKSNNGGK